MFFFNYRLSQGFRFEGIDAPHFASVVFLLKCVISLRFGYFAYIVVCVLWRLDSHFSEV